MIYYWHRLVFPAWGVRYESYLVGLEGHGREPIGEDVDVSRTVGWFTAYIRWFWILTRGSTALDNLCA
ncbi:hypothetical protein OHD16_27175 [Sphingobacterium sp. ML3W]|uniref:hypothetical protein n=1 Tax=Sphingobacterium sp. ML3W TaxID=1538644 RepID=UPI003009D2DF